MHCRTSGCLNSTGYLGLVPGSPPPGGNQGARGILIWQRGAIKGQEVANYFADLTDLGLWEAASSDTSKAWCVLIIGPLSGAQSPTF